MAEQNNATIESSDKKTGSVIFIIIVLLLIIILSVFAYMQYNKTSETRVEITNEEILINAAKARITNQQKIKEREFSLTEEYNYYTNIMSMGENQSLYLTRLNTLAALYNVEIVYTKINESSINTTYTEYPLVLQTRSTYRSLLGFIDSLYDSKYPIRVDGVKMLQQNDDGMPIFAEIDIALFGLDKKAATAEDSKESDDNGDDS